MSTLLLLLSDMHSSSSYAPLWRGYDFEEAHVEPSPLQTYLAEEIDKLLCKLPDRDDLVIVNMGDGIEGFHHNSHAIVTHHLDEQARIHIDQMRHIYSIIGKPKELFYISGTDAHGERTENFIAEELGAVGGVHKTLRLYYDSISVEMTHQFASPGYGLGAGNSMRSRLRDMMFTKALRGEPLSDYYCWGHYHLPRIEHYSHSGYQVTGMSLPSFKVKDKYINEINPFFGASIGIGYILLDGDNTYARILTSSVDQVSEYQL